MWFDKCVGVSCHEILGERFGHSQALYVMKVVRALRSIEIYPALSDLFFLTHCNVLKVASVRVAGSCVNDGHPLAWHVHLNRTAWDCVRRALVTSCSSM